MTTYELYAKKYGTCIEYKEIFVLNSMLNKARIPHTFDKVFDGWQVILFNPDGKRIADAVQHFSSYGCQNDRLEEMGLMKSDEEAVGNVTAKEVFDCWLEKYIKLAITAIKKNK